MEKVAMQIEGMSCGHCVRVVEGALNAVDGVEVERVEVGAARVRFDAGRTDAGSIKQAIEEAGYPVAGSETVS